MIDWTVYRDGVAFRVQAPHAYDAVWMTPVAGPLPMVGAVEHAHSELLFVRHVGADRSDKTCEVVSCVGERALEIDSIECVDIFTMILAWAAARREYKRVNAQRLPYGQAARDRQHERVAGANAMIVDVTEAFDVADTSWQALLRRTEHGSGRCAELRTLLDEPGGVLRNSLGARLAEVERALSCVQSVQDVGMGAGAPVVVLPSGHADDPAEGPGVVIDVHPIETTRFAQYHSREVRLRDGTELSISTERLTAV